MEHHHKIKEKGASLVEMAIIVLLFFTVVFGIIEFGLFLYNQQVITNSAREATRVAIVARDEDNPVDSDDIIEIATNYIESNIVSKANSQPNVIVKYYPRPVDISNPAYTGEDSSTLNSIKLRCGTFGDALEVEINYLYSFFFLPFAEKKMKSKAFMFCEGGPVPPP